MRKNIRKRPGLLPKFLISLSGPRWASPAAALGASESMPRRLCFFGKLVIGTLRLHRNIDCCAAIISDCTPLVGNSCWSAPGLSLPNRPPTTAGAPEDLTIIRKVSRSGSEHVRPAADYEVTRTSTVIPAKASDIPEKLPVTGIVWRISRATATGIRLTPPTLRLVGSKVIQPAPGT